MEVEYVLVERPASMVWCSLCSMDPKRKFDFYVSIERNNE